MRGAPFDALLTGPLSSRVVWERAYPCPCVDSDGSAERKCGVCGGTGRYFDHVSDEFRCGITGLSAKALAGIQQRLGPGMVGDGMASVPGCAPCWDDIAEGDRLVVLDALDPLKWVLTPGNPVRLPMGSEILRARVRANDGLSVVEVDPPLTDAGGRVSVAVVTTLAMRAPRRYEVVRDLSQVRAFGERLPKKLLVKLIDWTVR